MSFFERKHAKDIQQLQDSLTTTTFDPNAPVKYDPIPMQQYEADLHRAPMKRFIPPEEFQKIVEQAKKNEEKKRRWANLFDVKSPERHRRNSDERNDQYDYETNIPPEKIISRTIFFIYFFVFVDISFFNSIQVIVKT